MMAGNSKIDKDHAKVVIPDLRLGHLPTHNLKGFFGFNDVGDFTSWRF